tara:strand:+ start:119 stop:280 length:162 start_codon:yes stop_codon:yes gene_type:complete
MSGFGGGYFYMLYKYETIAKKYKSLNDDYIELSIRNSERGMKLSLIERNCHVE